MSNGYDEPTCYSCDRPLADGESEACARCWQDPDAVPVAEEVRAEGRACLDAYDAYREACADYDALDARCQELLHAAATPEEFDGYRKACKERRAAFAEAEACWDRWMAAAKQAA